MLVLLEAIGAAESPFHVKLPFPELENLIQFAKNVLPQARASGVSDVFCDDGNILLLKILSSR